MLAAWEVNPKSRLCAPEIRNAYEARTLHLITIDLGNGYFGYAWASNAERAEDHAARLRCVPSNAKRSITVAPYPYAIPAQ